MEKLSIKTTVIEVKVLKVNNRKMTLSVFKQIPYKCPLDDKHELIGNLWGYVNYFWGRASRIQAHLLHILFEFEGKLYRGYVPTHWSYHDRESLWISEEGDFAEDYIHSELIPVNPTCWIEKIEAAGQIFIAV